MDAVHGLPGFGDENRDHGDGAKFGRYAIGEASWSHCPGHIVREHHIKENVCPEQGGLGGVGGQEDIEVSEVFSRGRAMMLPRPEERGAGRRQKCLAALSG